MKTFLTLLIAMLLPMIANAWEPTKPVNVVIAYGPGSGNEVLFRKLESIISKTEKVKFVIELKPGAFELIGMNHFATVPNDGYTLYAPGVGAYFGTPVWYKSQLKQDPTEWELIANLGESPIALFARNSSKASTPADVFAELKAGSKIDVGVGAPVFVIAYEYMAKQSKATNAQRVQYNSPAAVTQALAAGDIEFGLTPLSVGIELMKAGKIKLIGISGQGDYPALSTQFKGLDLVAHAGIVAPPGTSPDVLAYYKRVFASAVATDEYKDFLKSIHWYDSLKTSDNYKKFFNAQRKQWIPVAETIEFK
jgi:tripartite-type tricarboxylate transporter receptor subunit TctC